MLKWCSILELIVDHFFILKAQQQRHERDLALLKLKAEQEALECQRQLEETRNKAAQVLNICSMHWFGKSKFISLESLQFSFNYLGVKKERYNNALVHYAIWVNFMSFDSGSSPMS